LSQSEQYQQRNSHETKYQLIYDHHNKLNSHETKRKTDASSTQEPMKKRARPQGQRRPYQGFMTCANPTCISNHVAVKI
jgi:hypothetical protein